MDHGYLVVFRKGKSSAPYELDEGEHSIGSSVNCNIRLKFSHPDLMDTHALIRINENGVATIINKSVGAPVKVNGKAALRPTILKHEDKFEILDKVFQYFNEHLKNEPEDSVKFVKEKMNILSTNRQSVNPVIRTPAKKTPHIKTRTPSIRKSTSAVSRPAKGVQVIITPNKKPDNLVGSKTTSKIIVSKALVSPHSARKQRLSLDNTRKTSRSPKISSRNILLSKSTINITISEEHEYSEMTPSTSMKTIKEGDGNSKSRTSRRSVKVENVDTLNKDISVDLINFDSPSTAAINSPSRRSVVRRQSTELHPNIMKTPVNKRIQSLKNVRHSLKKDTPPPRSIPKVTVQAPTPQGKGVAENGGDMSITYSPNAEPDTHNITRRTPRRSIVKKFEENGDPANNSRVSFAIEAPTEGSLINPDILDETKDSADEGEVVTATITTKVDNENPRKSKGKRSVVNNEMQHASRRSTKSKQSLVTAEVESVLEQTKGRRSSEFENLAEPLLDSSAEEMDDLQLPESDQFKDSSLSEDVEEENVAKTRGASLNVSARSTMNKSASFSVNGGVTASLTKKSRSSRDPRTSNIQNKSRDDSATERANSQSIRLSRNTSRNASKLEKTIESSLTEDNDSDFDSSVKNSSRLSTKTSGSTITSDDKDNMKTSFRASRNASSISTDVEAVTNSSQTDNNTTDAEDNVGVSTRVSRNASKRGSKVDTPSFSETEEITTDEENKVNKSSRASRNISTRSTNMNEAVNYSQTEDNDTDTDNINQSSEMNRKSSRSTRASRDMSRRSTSMSAAANYLQAEDDTSDTDGNINRSTKVTSNASRRSNKIQMRPSISQTEDYTSDTDGIINKSSDVTSNASKRSKLQMRPSISQTEDDTSDTDGIINTSSDVTSNASRRSKIQMRPSISQTEDDTSDTDGIINKSSDVTSNASRRSKIQIRPSISQTEDDTSDTDGIINKSSDVTSNASRRQMRPSISQTEDDTSDADGIINKSSDVTSNASRRSKIQMRPSISQTEDDTTDAEDNANKSSRASIRVSKRSINISGATNSSQPADALEADDNVNKPFNIFSNTSRGSTKVQARNVSNSSRSSRSNRILKHSTSLLTEDNAMDKEEESLGESTKSSSQQASVSVLGQTPDKSLRNSARRRAKSLNSQSSIDSAETTVHNKNEKEPDITNSTKNKSLQGLSLFDESTQEAKPKANTSKNGPRQRASIFDESTKEVWPELDSRKSVTVMTIVDDTQEVLSPVRPLSARKSIRNIQNQDLDGPASPSIRVSSIRQTRTKSQILHDSSLTSTSMDQSSSSVISVSSQSFSSFKKGSSGRDVTEIDVVNISSMSEASEVEKSFITSGGLVKNEVMDQSNTSRSSKRQSRTSEMFKDVSCTSTPFHKQNKSKKSQDSLSSSSENVSHNKKSSSSVALVSKSLDVFTISSTSDSVFLNSSAEKGSRSSVYDQSGAAKRRTSSRSSGTRQGEHNCVSCRNSSVDRRSRSLSSTGEPSVVEKGNEVSSRPSKIARKSSASGLEQSYEDTSPVKRISSARASKQTTPLLHRKSLATSLSEKTPEKAAETEDETPKSSIKPARRSSKANQSTYNPLLEDITPVTPEKLMVSGFTEDVFKTPINTPGLFENIRKSVIRSRKRHRESTGSTMKNSKRARVDFAQDEQLEASPEAQEIDRPIPRKSPLNRLSNFDGVKKLMRTPPKSPKNDLRNIPNLRSLVSPKKQASPKNDLTNVAGIKRLLSTPKEIRSPKNDLTNIPNLRRFVSPKRQNTPKNDLTAPLGVIRLLKTPKIEKEPVNDLANVTGVAGIFNVSGVEVLHQGSDIENSEDLFTKLTGQRPVKAYPRGKSLSPNKEDQQERARSRKTMGDIPICSPRVQQWVEDHTNVNYATTEESRGLLLSADKDLIFNVSDKPKRRSKSGRSVSPKKSAQGTGNRRKTQGDVLGDSPNITAWKDEQANRAKTARSVNIKAEVLSPNPTLQTPVTKAELQRLSDAENGVAPKEEVEAKKPARGMQEESAKNASLVAPVKVPDVKVKKTLRARRGKKIEELVKEASDTEDNSTDTEVEFKRPVRGRPKKVKAELPSEDVATLVSPANRVTRTAALRSTADDASATSSPARATRGRRVENVQPDHVEEEKEAKAPVKRGRGRKAIVVSEKEAKDADIELPKKATRGKKAAEVIKDMLPDHVEEEKEAKAPVKRGRGRKLDAIVVSEKEVKDTDIELPKKATRGKKATEVIEDMLPDHVEEEKEAKAPVKRGRGRKVDAIVVSEKEAKDADIELPKKATRGKNAAKVIEDILPDHVEEEKEAKASVKRGRGRKVDAIVVSEKEAKDADIELSKKTRGKRAAKVIEDIQPDHVEEEKEAKAPVKRGRGRKVDAVVVSEKEAKDTDIELPKNITRGKKAAKVIEDIQPDHVEENGIRKGPAKLRRGRIFAVDEPETDQETDAVEIESPKKATRSRKRKEDVRKMPEKASRNGDKSEEPQGVREAPKKPSTRPRGKKVTEETPDEASSEPAKGTRKVRNKVIEEVIEMDVDSPRTARAKRGVNKKYSIDEYEVKESKSGSKRKVRFEEDSTDKKPLEVDSRKSKRTRK